MSKKLELSGQRFGRWLVIKKAGKNKCRKITWECLCDCGNIKVVVGGSLKKGVSRSCGCLRKEQISRIKTTHGRSKTLTHKIWRSMLQRCNNPKDKGYKYYGKRGIKVCKRWNRFENFFADMGEKPKKMTIERINNGKGYYKGNCKWASWVEQRRNQRLNKRNTSGTQGVSWCKRTKKYVARITVEGKCHHLGSFDDLNDAILTRKRGETIYWNVQK